MSNPSPEETIQGLVDRETDAWNRQDAEALVSLFHPDMVWPWPPDASAHDPALWVFPLGRFDRERWKRGWEELFRDHELVHNRRGTVRIVVSEEGDGGFAVVDVDTLWRRRDDGRAVPLEGARVQGIHEGRGPVVPHPPHRAPRRTVPSATGRLSPAAVSSPVMALSAFDDPARPPEARGRVPECLSGAAPLMGGGHRARSRRPARRVTEAWAFAGAKFGWSLRLKRGERVILYLTPQDGTVPRRRRPGREGGRRRPRSRAVRSARSRAPRRGAALR